MTPARSERSGEVRVPAPRGMMKEGGEVVDDDDDVENEEDDTDAEYSTETIGDELVAAWGMREEPAEESEEEEGEDTSERPLNEDDEDDYESIGDLGDVVDMSLERIDDFEEEYEDDNLKVEGQVSNRRVDLGDVERVREPWPTKSRQGASTRQPLQQVEKMLLHQVLVTNWSHLVTIVIAGHTWSHCNEWLVTFAAT